VLKDPSGNDHRFNLCVPSQFVRQIILRIPYILSFCALQCCRLNCLSPSTLSKLISAQLRERVLVSSNTKVPLEGKDIRLLPRLTRYWILIGPKPTIHHDLIHPDKVVTLQWTVKVTNQESFSVLSRKYPVHSPQFYQEVG
jgi:hypothetical protein